MCPLLFAFQSPECALPPVLVEPLPISVAFHYRLVNGFHRFYASVHVGYTHIPVEEWIPPRAKSLQWRSNSQIATPSLYRTPRTKYLLATCGQQPPLVNVSPAY